MTRPIRPRRLVLSGDTAADTGTPITAELGYAALIAGGMAYAAGTASLAAKLRRSRDQRRLDALMGKLWAAVKLMAPGAALTDPATGCRVTLERDAGFVILAIGDPPHHRDVDAIVTRYILGFWAVPDRAPMYRYTSGIHDHSPARMGWHQRQRLKDFNAETSALEVTAEEIAELIRQVTRSVAADPH